jgi:hypothetical protein
MLYLQSGTRSNGNDDIPAPVLGVSTTGKPETDLLVVPDLDGQVWGLVPTSLASAIKLVSAGTSVPFPLFDIERYWGQEVAGGSRFQSTGPVLIAPAAVTPQLVTQAAFANPAVVLPAGACPGTGNGTNDPVVILATGGVDWGSQASLVVALDVGVNDFQLGAAGSSNAQANGSASELLPIGPLKNNLEVPTCENAILTTTGACVGRVFGQPLVVGSDVLFNTNTGILTGQGSSLAQQTGDGTISTLGGSSGCEATNSCNICQTSEQSVDLATNVGKMASGLTAIAGNGNVQVFGASTTGVSNIVVASPASVPQNLFQKLALQQWWLRPQRPSCPVAGDPSCTH